MNIKRNLKIRDMAARNVNGIKGRRERENQAHESTLQEKCERLSEEIQNNVCGGESTKLIEELIDVLDTVKLIEEEGYGQELRNWFVKDYDMVGLYPEYGRIDLKMHNRFIVRFTLPDIEGDFVDMSIRLEMPGCSPVVLPGAGAPWVFALRPFVEKLDDSDFNIVIEDVITIGEIFRVMPDDFFNWVNENFPEEA